MTVADPMTGISLSDVTVQFGDRVALERMTATLAAPRIAVIGSNGSGKSTFARVLGGLVAATHGTVTVHGLDPVRDSAALRRRTSFVFSNPDAQIIMPTVAEDVAFSLRGDRLPRTERAERVTAALDRFGLSALADSAAHELSGGQKQLLAVCSALVRDPDLVIADEPTAFLDARNSIRIADHLLASANDAGSQLVLVTHDLKLAMRCDLAVQFDDARLVAVGTPAEVIERYETMLRC